MQSFAYCYPVRTVKLLLPVLAVFASISPLLTLAWLWQVKEWRWDRLTEHLRREEGSAGQLWGKARPAIVGIYVIGGMAEWWDVNVGGWAAAAALFILSVLAIAQIGLRRQRMPVWTGKALALASTAMMLTGVISASLARVPPLLPVVVLMQPFALAAAWLMWRPVDIFLKNRVIARAKSLRERHPDLIVIGVTGSVGKTTTKELLACVLKDFNPVVTPAYMNAEIGVARWMMGILTPRPSSTAGQKPALMIVEMGAYRKGEISILCSFVRPTIGVVTNAGAQHVALFGSRENLFEAKSELVRSLPPEGRAFLNGDNELSRKMADLSPCPVTIVGTGGRCDLEAFDIEETSTGIRFRLVHSSLACQPKLQRKLGEGGARDVMFEVPLHGTHNVTNVLLALAVGEHLGIVFERMRVLLKSFAPMPHTFSVRDEAGIRILDDTHNSSAAGVKAAIAWARNQPEEHKILLASGLIEMGDLQYPAEKELGALAAGVFKRVVIMDSASSQNFADGGADVEVFSKKTVPVPSGSLLVCAGRMPQSAIRRLLPD